MSRRATAKAEIGRMLAEGASAVGWALLAGLALGVVGAVSAHAWCWIAGDCW